jgi:hypothetical protein
MQVQDLGRPAQCRRIVTCGKVDAGSSSGDVKRETQARKELRQAALARASGGWRPAVCTAQSGSSWLVSKPISTPFGSGAASSASLSTSLSSSLSSQARVRLAARHASPLANQQARPENLEQRGGGAQSRCVARCPPWGSWGCRQARRRQQGGQGPAGRAEPALRAASL